MSRDFYTYDPQEIRDGKPRRHIQKHEPEVPDARQGRAPAGRSAPDLDALDPRKPEILKSRTTDSPRAYYLRDRAYLLHQSQVHSLAEIGKFRVVVTADLAKYGYAGDTARMERDLKHLKAHSLVEVRAIEISQKKSLRMATLTKAGHRLLRKTNQFPEDQSVYHGLAKPREAKHDADLYRLYHKEAASIVRAGGKPVRVILDYELKQHLYRDLAKLGAEKDDLKKKQEAAEKHGLELVNGKIPVPDLRVEYETAELELRRVDLELATHHYRPRGLAEKARAGFSLYGHSEDVSRLRRILNDRELTADILAL